MQERGGLLSIRTGAPPQSTLDDGPLLPTSASDLPIVETEGSLLATLASIPGIPDIAIEDEEDEEENPLQVGKYYYLYRVHSSYKLTYPMIDGASGDGSPNEGLPSPLAGSAALQEIPSAQPNPMTQPSLSPSQLTPGGPSPEPSFYLEATQEEPAGILPQQSQPMSAIHTASLPDEEFAKTIRTRWAQEAELLGAFKKASWGTAYQTVAEVQLLLRIGQSYDMTLNFPSHSVSLGNDDKSAITGIEIQLLGSYLNGQAFGTWTNKFTFFFAIYDFLQRTQNATVEGVGTSLYEIRKALLSWKVGLEIPDAFLPAGDPRAKFKLTPLHVTIREYAVGLLQLSPSICH